MSQWTHVEGVVRLDVLDLSRPPQHKIEELRKKYPYAKLGDAPIEDIIKQNNKRYRAETELENKYATDYMPIIRKAFGEVVRYQDLCEGKKPRRYMPSGEEGTITWDAIRTNPVSSMSWGHVVFSGDLRDKGAETINEVKKWLERAISILSKNNIGIRGLTATVRVEYGKTAIMTVLDSEGPIQVVYEHKE